MHIYCCLDRLQDIRNAYLNWCRNTYTFYFFFFNRRILLHGKNSQKRDNIKKKDSKTTNNLTYVHK